MDIFNIKLIGEPGDQPPVIGYLSTVIKVKYGRFKLLANATFYFYSWEYAILFPDNEKAEYFINNFKPNMSEYQEGMLKDDYIFHIVHFKYPKVDTLYADQLRMTKDYVKELY